MSTTWKGQLRKQKLKGLAKDPEVRLGEIPGLRLLRQVHKDIMEGTRGAEAAHLFPGRSPVG